MLNIKPDTDVTAPQALADIDSYLALKAIPGYTPHNPAHSVEAATAAYNELRAAEEDVLLAENALAAARDAVMDGRRALRNVIIGAKNEVRVIYGVSSNELASLGIKKKSDYAKHSSPAKKNGNASGAAPDAP
jgi:hypothetical protein